MPHDYMICKTPQFENLVKLHSSTWSLKMMQKDVPDTKNDPHILINRKGWTGNNMHRMTSFLFYVTHNERCSEC